MKREARALLTTATLFGLLTAGTAAHADSKQECAAAYEKTQALRETGQLRDARLQAIACSAPTCSAYVTRDCLQWLTEIDGILPTVVFTADDGAGADIVAVRVTVDGQTAAAKLDGKAVSLDPGEHVVRFEMAGAPAIEQKVLIRQGEKNRRLAASFKKAPPLTPPAQPPTAPPVKPTVAAASEAPFVPEPAPRRGGVPTWAWIAGGAGVAALGVSAGFGASALGAQSKLVTACGGNPALCPKSTQAVTVPLADQRTLDRNVFLGLAAAGVVGIGAAILGIATAPPKASSPQTSLVVAPYGSSTGAGLALQGLF
jgi:hypothetical protein